MVVAATFQAAEVVVGVVTSSFFTSQLPGLKAAGYGNGMYTKGDQRCWRCSYTDDSLVDADRKLSKRKNSRKVRKDSQKASAAAGVAEETSTLCSEGLRLTNSFSALLEAAYRQPAFEPMVSPPTGEERDGPASRSAGMDSAQPLVYRYKKMPRMGLATRSSLRKARIENLMKARELEESNKSVESSTGKEMDIWSLEAEVMIKEHPSNNVNLSMLDWDRLPRKCLTASEEVQLANCMVPARRLQQLKAELSEHLKREPSNEEWAEAAKMTVPTLRRYLQVAQAARNKMIKHNLRLVAFQAHKYFKAELSLSLVDLCQEGVPGLVRAVEKFDPKKGYRFSTYAVYWVKNNILRAQTRLGHIMRVPFNVAAQKMQIYKVRAHLATRLNREPTHQEVMKEMKIEPKRYFQVLQTGAARWSLNARSKITGDELIHQLADKDEAEAHYFRAGARLRFGMDDVLDSLKPKESLVIRQRYGLDGKGERSFTEIGRNLNLSREMVRKYEIRGMMKLRHPTRIKYLRDFLL